MYRPVLIFIRRGRNAARTENRFALFNLRRLMGVLASRKWNARARIPPRPVPTPIRHGERVRRMENKHERFNHSHRLDVKEIRRQSVPVRIPPRPAPIPILPGGHVSRTARRLGRCSPRIRPAVRAEIPKRRSHAPTPAAVVRQPAPLRTTPGAIVNRMACGRARSPRQHPRAVPAAHPFSPKPVPIPAIQLPEPPPAPIPIPRGAHVNPMESKRVLFSLLLLPGVAVRPLFRRVVPLPLLRRQRRIPHQRLLPLPRRLAPLRIPRGAIASRTVHKRVRLLLQRLRGVSEIPRRLGRVRIPRAMGRRRPCLRALTPIPHGGIVRQVAFKRVRFFRTLPPVAWGVRQFLNHALLLPPIRRSRYAPIRIARGDSVNPILSRRERYSLKRPCRVPAIRK